MGTAVAEQSEKAAVREKFTSERRKWHESYASTAYPALGLQWRQANGVALCRTTIAEGGRILEVGCGAGHASVELARTGYEVVGVDISQPMIDQATANAADAGVSHQTHFAATDFGYLGSGEHGSFDGVLGLGFIEYFDDPASVLRQCRELLNPGGVVVIQFWNPRPAAARWIDPLLLRLRSLLRPFETIRRHRARRPGEHPERSPQAPAVVDTDGVTHRRYTPAMADQLAAAAGLSPVTSAGSLFFSRRTPIADPRKAQLDLVLQRIAARSRWLRRQATDYILASRA